MDDVVLKKAEPLGRTYRRKRFEEVARWIVEDGGIRIGEIWKASDGNVVCWMSHSDVLGWSRPDSYVRAGYARTTKKAVVRDVVDLHRCLDRRIERTDGWTLYLQAPERSGSSGWMGRMGSDTWRGVHLEHVVERNRNRGAMAEPGWYAFGHRGHRQIGVYGAADRDEALDLLLPSIVAEPQGVEAGRPGMLEPSMEVIQGSLAIARRNRDAGSAPASQAEESGPENATAMLRA